MKKTYVFILLFIMMCLKLNAQNPYAIHITSEVGLPSNNVYNVFEDNKGYIWFATNEGICKYDGVFFKSYNTPQQSTKGGSAIKQDKLGRIWYQNFDGYLFYIEKDSLHALNQNTSIGFSNYGITEKYLFLPQINSIAIYDLKTLQLINNIKINYKACYDATAINNLFYIILDDEIYTINETFAVRKIKLIENLKKDFKQFANCNDEVIIYSRKNENECLYTINKEKLEIYKTVKNIFYIQSANCFNKNIFLNTPNGTYSISKQNNSQKLLYQNKSISCVIKDKSKNYWFASTNEGVQITPSLNYEIINNTINAPNKIDLVNKNTLYTATKNGKIFSSDLNFTQLTEILSNDEKSEITLLYNDTNTITAHVSSSGITFNKNKETYNYNYAVKDIIELDEKYFAIASSGFWGLIKNPFLKEEIKSIWDSAYSKNLKNNIHTSNFQSSIRAKSITVANNKIYCATNIGLFTYKDELREIKINNQKIEAKQIEAFNNVVYILQNNGELILLLENNNVQSVSKYFNLTNEEIIKIKKQNNKLIIQGKQKLYVLNTENNKLSTINTYEEANGINDFLIVDKNFYFILNDEIRRIIDYEKQTNLIAPVFFVNTIKTKNKFIANTSNFNLKHYENNIEINYSFLDYTKKNKLYYKINQQDWQELTSQNNAIKLNELSYGNYSIYFKINNNNTELNQVINFTISKPFWITWWFYSLSIFASLSILFWYYKYQLNLLQTKNKLLTDKVELEKNLRKSTLTSIKAQMNPHFFYNALNTIQAYIFTNDKRKASDYLVKFSNLTRLILEMSEKEKITLHEEIKSITLYLELEKMRFDKDFEFEINIEKMNLDSILIPSMLLQPYIENAIKHGLLHQSGKKKVAINFIKNENTLIVEIDDNGIGREKAELINSHKKDKPKSFSSNANQIRLDIINKELKQKVSLQIIDKYNEQNSACGTKVILNIPI